MGYNEKVNQRIGKIVSHWKNCEQKRMFGGVYKDFLILRLGEDLAEDALKLPGTKPFDITGRPMKGWVMV